MTETGWKTCEDPAAMLAHVCGVLSERKLRLFSCACCHRAWGAVTDERLGQALDALERYADGNATEKQRIEAGRRSEAVRREFYDAVGKEEEVCVACELSFAAAKTMRRVARDCGQRAASAFAWADVGKFADLQREERGAQASLLRDIVGDPFCPVPFPSAWRTEAAVGLARRMYEARDFGAMPILADALEEAGCDDALLLEHCRGPGPHVRGCWVVDQVLGRE